MAHIGGPDLGLGLYTAVPNIDCEPARLDTHCHCPGDNMTSHRDRLAGLGKTYRLLYSYKA